MMPEIHLRDQSPICQYVYLRFTEAFGLPNTTMGQANHWKLQSSAGGAGTAGGTPINLLLDGTREIAAIWIFDSNDRDVGVVSASVSQKVQVEAIIKEIQDRVKRATGTA